MADFKKAYKKTGMNEGGWCHVPGDTGGETYAGISRKWFPKWSGWKIVDQKKPLRHNQKIHSDQLEAEVESFYRSIFWDAIGGDQIEDQMVAERMYDFGVNAGQPRSISQVQAVLGIPATGKLDAKTIDAINNPEKYLI